MLSPRSFKLLCYRSRPFSSSRATLESSASVTLAADFYSPSSSSTVKKGPLVILHGLYGSKQNYRSLAKGMANQLGRDVYALDLRNHGTSPHNASTSYEDQASDVSRFLDSKGLKDVVLAGHSMGGKVAMALTLRPHSSISKLIVIDISPAIGAVSPDFANYIEGMKEIEKAEIHSRKEADEILQKYEPNLGIRQFLLTNLDRTEATAPYTFRIPLDILSAGLSRIGEFPYEAGSTSWAGPTLILKGAKSKYINRRNIPLIEAFFPAMQLKVLDTGHWVHAEKPKEFMKEVVDFCQ